jgi:adenylate kinase
METRTIFFVGKPGCGKGTQAELLAKATGWPVFSSGKLFRDLERENTPVGRKLKAENEAGFLSPHWFAMYLYLTSLFSIKDGASAIFDGFNRKLPEAELIVSSLTWLGRPFSIVHIAVGDEEIIERLRKRQKTSGRADDAAIDERMKEYYEHTAPAIELFRDAGVLIDIDGGRPPEAIAVDVTAALNIAPRTDSGPAA